MNLRFLIIFLPLTLYQIDILAQRHSYQNNPSDPGKEISKKLSDAFHIAEGLIYSHEKLDKNTSHKFLEKVILLDLVNLKAEMDKVNRDLIDEDYYVYLFVKFPNDFDEYLHYYLLDEINNIMDKGDRMRKNKATVAALNAVDTALNLINASLMLKPDNTELILSKKRAEEFKRKLVITESK